MSVRIPAPSAPPGETDTGPSPHCSLPARALHSAPMRRFLSLLALLALAAAPLGHMAPARAAPSAHCAAMGGAEKADPGKMRGAAIACAIACAAIAPAPLPLPPPAARVAAPFDVPSPAAIVGHAAARDPPPPRTL
jgi:hypothetical protein